MAGKSLSQDANICRAGVFGDILHQSVNARKARDLLILEPSYDHPKHFVSPGLVQQAS